jgi:hypothetical protein
MPNLWAIFGLGYVVGALSVLIFILIGLYIIG